MDLYSYANGDPINYFDADGWLAIAGQVGQMEGLADFAVGTWDSWALLTAQGHLANRLFGEHIDNARSSLQDLLNPILNEFEPWQHNVWIGSAVVGEVAPNFIPIAGVERATATAVAPALAWLGRQARHVGGWLNDVAPALNPGNYSFNTGRTYSGLPLPEYTPPALPQRAGPLPPGEQPYQLLLFPDVRYSRYGHYGDTPTLEQQMSVPAGMEFDHIPTLLEHYYLGPGDGSLPGFNLTQIERLRYARSLESGAPATPHHQRVQGGEATQLSKELRRLNGL